MRRVLVIGAGGYLGRNVLDLLRTQPDLLVRTASRSAPAGGLRHPVGHRRCRCHATGGGPHRGGAGHRGQLRRRGRPARRRTDRGERNRSGQPGHRPLPGCGTGRPADPPRFGRRIRDDRDRRAGHRGHGGRAGRPLRAQQTGRHPTGRARAARSGWTPWYCGCSTRSARTRRRAVFPVVWSGELRQGGPRSTTTSGWVRWIRCGISSMCGTSRRPCSPRSTRRPRPAGAQPGQRRRHAHRSIVDELVDIAGFGGTVLESAAGSSRSASVPWQQADITAISTLLGWKPRVELLDSLADLWRSAR